MNKKIHKIIQDITLQSATEKVSLAASFLAYIQPYYFWVLYLNMYFLGVFYH